MRDDFSMQSIKKSSRTCTVRDDMRFHYTIDEIQMVRLQTLTCVITSRRRSFPTRYSRISSALSHHFSVRVFTSPLPACEISIRVRPLSGSSTQPKQQYMTPFHSNSTSSPRRIHCLKSEIVLKRLSSKLFVPPMRSFL